MKHLRPADTLEIKIQLFRGFIAEIEDNELYKEPGGGRLFWVMLLMEEILVKQQTKTRLNFDDLANMKNAVRQCATLLFDLSESHPDEMQGWSHGIEPLTPEHALANTLSRMILDFSGTIFAFESFFPEMKAEFDAERARHAARITAAEEAEGRV